MATANEQVSVDILIEHEIEKLYQEIKPYTFRMRLHILTARFRNSLLVRFQIAGFLERLTDCIILIASESKPTTQEELIVLKTLNLDNIPFLVAETTDEEMFFKFSTRFIQLLELNVNPNDVEAEYLRNKITDAKHWMNEIWIYFSFRKEAELAVKSRPLIIPQNKQNGRIN